MKNLSTYLKAALLVSAVVFILSSLFREQATTEPGDRYRDAFGTRFLFDNYGTTQLVPLTLASETTMVVTKGTVFSVSGTKKITRLTNGTAVSNLRGRLVIFRSVTTDTLVDGVNLKLAGNFNGTADDVIGLIYNISNAASDTFWTETFRSVN